MSCDLLKADLQQERDKRLQIEAQPRTESHRDGELQVELAALRGQRDAEPTEDQLSSIDEQSAEQRGRTCRRLRPLEKRLLEWLAIGDEMETVEDLSHLLKISRLRTRHLLETLRDETELVHVIHNEVFLADSGKDYVLKNGWRMAFRDLRETASLTTSAPVT